VAGIAAIKQELCNALVSIDAIEKARAVADLKGKVTFPGSFCRRNVYQDT
jgi:hypothetical protein